MNAAELAFAGIARQAELIRDREVSPRELVETYLERIARLDPSLNAFRVVWPERALAEAKEAESQRAVEEERPLHGVPIAIKDTVDVAGEVTTHGCAYGMTAGADAEIVRRLRAAGAIPIGKTHTPELAISGFTESATWGITRNPWNPDRTPGGSSGGAAAAVAAGLVGAAQGSDGAGSIRIPAACCGLFGLKPQRGRISLMPEREHWHGLTVLGCLTRRVIDTALFCDVVAGGAAGDATVAKPLPGSLRDAAGRDPGKLRIAFSLKPVVPTRIDAQVRRGVLETADLLRSLGHEVAECDPRYGTIGNTFLPRYLGGISDDAARMPRPDRLERRTQALARVGRLLRPVVARARASEGRHAARINRVFERFDVLVTPVIARPPVEIGRWEGRGALRTLLGMAAVYPFTGVWNSIGQPAAAVPAGFTDDGLPLSVQLVGRADDEPLLTSLAAQLEQARQWADRLPPLAVYRRERNGNNERQP